jgi:hypothetical protein
MNFVVLFQKRVALHTLQLNASKPRPEARRNSPSAIYSSCVKLTSAALPMVDGQKR